MNHTVKAWEDAGRPHPYAAFRAGYDAAVANFLETTGRYVTNDATREAAIKEAVELDRQQRGEAVALTWAVIRDHLGSEMADALCVTRWKDGIDIQEPVAGLTTLIATCAAPQPAEPVDNQSLAAAALELAEHRLDGVYSQRNALAIAFVRAALAAGWKAGRGIDPSHGEDGWQHVVYVDLPDGRQVSWHMAPQDVPLLDGLPQYGGQWDGTFVGRDVQWCAFGMPVVKGWTQMAIWSEVEPFPVQPAASAEPAFWLYQSLGDENDFQVYRVRQDGPVPGWKEIAVYAAPVAAQPSVLNLTEDLSMMCRRLILDVRALADEEGPEAARLSRANQALKWLQSHGLAGSPLRDAPTPPAGGQAQQDDLAAIYDAFGIGSQARELHVLMVCISNARRRSQCLTAIEDTFFTVPGEPDEDYPDEPPADECLLNWGSSPGDYVTQFRRALDRINASQQDADKVDAERYRWLREKHDGDGPAAAVRCLNGPYLNQEIYGDQLDAAIDAARAAKESNHG